MEDGSKRIRLLFPPTSARRPFCQSAVKQTTGPARLGPAPDRPHFQVRFALPVPPDNDTNLTGALAGVDPAVWAHNHSPGFEVLPNGDLLAVWFSARAPNGTAESAPDTRFVQARLRHGAEEWDMPELFYDLEGRNDQSGLLWRDGETVWFFGGGRGDSDRLPFKMAVSTNNGVTWTLSLPLLDAPARDCTPQPVVNAFRGPDRAIYLVMDAAGDQSFLWRSPDDGLHWWDQGGRTTGRHSTVVALDTRGSLLSIGGKNVSLNGWSPMNTSADWGRTWSVARPSPFPALASNQRPSLIRLANGHLCLVTDTYSRRTGAAPVGWPHGMGAVVAISTNNGLSWHFKPLPVQLPHERDRRAGTLGYATVRQAPNGLIHVLATMTHPCLHYEFNEAWVFSDAGDLAPERGGGRLETFREDYPDGRPRVVWRARICPNGRYLLDGTQTSYHPNGRKEHEVTYADGVKTGAETFWAEDGTKLWSWDHQPRRNTSVWTHYWPNGRKRLQSIWSTRPRARDLDRYFWGRVAHGPVTAWNESGQRTGDWRFADGTLQTAGGDRSRP